MSCIYDLGGVLGGLACGIIGDKYFVGKRTMLGALSCALLTFAIGGYQLAAAWECSNAIVMGLIGFLVAGPDAMLGSTAVADCCEQAGYGQEVLGTAAGIVNGMGSIGRCCKARHGAHRRKVRLGSVVRDARDALCALHRHYARIDKSSIR